MNNENGNKISDVILGIFQLFFYSIMLITLDIILVYFIDGDINSLSHVILLDLAIGLSFSLVLQATKGMLKKIIFVVVNVVMILYAILLFAEIFIKLSFEAFYPLQTILYNYRNALNEYHEDVKEIIKSRILLFVLLILMLMLTGFAGKVIYFDEKNKIRKPIILLSSIVIIFVTAAASVFALNKSSYDFSDVIINGGLKAAVYYEYNQNDNFSFDLTAETVQKNKDIDKNETEEDFEKIQNMVDVEENNVDIENTEKTENNNTNIENNNYDENIKETEDNNSNDKRPSVNRIKYDIVSSQNILDIDFESIIANETRTEYNNVNNFVMNRVPTSKNEYTGIFKGKNLIMICAEAFNSVIVNEDLFPTMYRLINNGFKFNNFYQPKGGSTSSGEYAFMTGMLPIYTDRSFVQSENNNMGFTISQKLKDEGYHTYSFHNGTSTFYSRDNTHGELMGFDSFMANDTGLSSLSGVSYPNDLQLFKSTFDIISKEKPFLAYYMTYSGHMPYTNFNTASRLAKVNDYYGDTKSLVVKTYIAKNLLLEEGLTNLITNLELAGMLNDTVICIVPDHYPYGLYNANAVTGEQTNYVAELYSDPFIEDHTMERDRTDLILWSGSLENEYKDIVKTVDKYCATVDVTPTLFNLFDIPYDSRLYPGRDIFSDAEGIVIYQNGKYITADETDDSATVDNTLKINHASYAKNLVNYCTFFIKNDYYGYLTGEKGNAQKICYLTFDGGPSDVTIEILDTLTKNDASACFFVVGDGKMEYIPEMSRRGNTVYPLSDTKDYDAMYLDDDTYITKLNYMRDQIKTYNGKDSLLFRFPYGSGNTETIAINQGIVTRLEAITKSMGLKFADWNVESGDSDPELSAEDIVSNVIEGAKGQDIICVHLHDTIDNINTSKALPDIIKNLKKEGYKFKALNRHSTNFKQTIVN